MATRATYRFFSKFEQGSDVFVYNHYDNYCAGAAEHFARALLHAGQASRLSAEAFIRGNERSHITDSHESHADTEYRYDIDVAAQTVTVWSRPGYEGEFQCVCLSSVSDFIQLYRKDQVA